MYRSGEEYDEIAKVIIDIYIDYDIKEFPLDAGEICRKLGVALVPYSAFNREGRRLLVKRSGFGFYDNVYSPIPTIYYNDSNESEGSIRFTIFHELKHYVFEDKDEKEGDLADYFSRYFMCPIPYFLLKNIDTPNELISYCGLSKTAAKNASGNIVNRREKHGYHLFDYEISLIEHLEPVLIEVFSEKEDDAYEGF